MQPAALQLERHFFSKVELEARMDGTFGVPNLLNCAIEIGTADDNARRFQVTLKVKLEPQPDKMTTYVGEIHAIGLFHVVDNWPEEKINQLVQSNGPAILFGAIRELVLNLTARGPWPEVKLNTFTFVLTEQQEKEDCPKTLTPSNG